MNFVKTTTKSLLLISLAMVLSCNITKNVPEGNYLLTKNSYQYKNIQLGASEALLYTKQKTNGNFLFFVPLGLLIYNIVPQNLLPVFKEYNNLSKKNRNQKNLDSLYTKYQLTTKLGRKYWFYNFCYKNGEKPVLFDSTLATSSAENIRQLYENKGFFNAKVKTKHKLKKSKKARVVYDIDLGKPHKIYDYSYSIEDSTQRKIFEEEIKGNSLIEVGKRYDLNILTKEKERIASEFKENGYYQFDEEVSQINFFADSTSLGAKKIDLFLKISPKEKNDSLIKPDKQFTYDKILIHTEKNQIDEKIDTLYRGYKISTKDNAYKLKTYALPMILEKGKIYKESDVANTKRNIIALDNFNIEKFEVKKNEETDSTLVADIKITRKKKNDVELFLESSYSDLFSLGLSPGVAYTRRNIFRGGENLRLSFKGTVGTVATADKKEGEIFNAYQIYAQIKLIFPYFLSPFKSKGILFKNLSPKTDINFGTSIQNNIGLDRVDFSTGLDYVLSPTTYQQHRITPFGIKVVRNIEAEKYFTIFSTDATIYADLSNDFLNYSINSSGNDDLYNQIFNQRNLSNAEIINELIYNQTDFISSLSTDNLNKYRNMLFRYQRITQNVLFNFFSYEYLYNGYENKYVQHPIYFSGKVETGGNVLGLIDKAFNISKKEENGWKSIFGVPYSQYVKIDLDFRKKWNLTINQQLIFRTFLGVSIPYGNLAFNPFEKTYFSGGSNDVRAWRAYSLGIADQGTNFGEFAVGDMKLTFNLEYRYKMAQKIYGAFFVDAGNIWNVNGQNSTQFKFNTFYNQLGMGPGTGIRFDLNYLILRFDWAYKLYDPSLIVGNRWNIKENSFSLYNTTLNFSINYPF